MEDLFMRTASSFFAHTAPFAKPCRLCVATLLALLLAACGTKPPVPVVTNVQMSVMAGADTNPDARKRPSPVVVRVYALKSSAAFDSADFFSLFDKDTATLGADLVQKEEFLMTPGQQKALPFKFEPEVKVIAVMAAFRDLENARWRAVQVLDVGKSAELTARLSGSQIKLEYKVTGLPTLPNSLPNLPQVPQTPQMPSMPAKPTMPTLPTMPTMPTAPTVPTLPTIPSF
jgi:type VI secretion system protein VasD